MKNSKELMLALVVCFVPFSVTASDTVALVESYVASGFQKGENQDPDRLVQDETQKACSVHRNKLPNDLAAALIEREKANIRYPEGGKLMGNWEAGEKAYKAGFAWRVGRIEPDSADKERGGNCYACHAADPKEVAAGTLGVPLTGYGKIRGTAEDAIKYTYEKIYNAQAFVPCSNMPRLGHNGVLSPAQVADIVAYLLDPASPVNQ